MTAAFSVTVTSREWLDEVESWIRDRAAEAERKLTGPIEQRRVRPWSTQIVAPTDQGLLWFKGNGVAMAFEPALHALLADLVPAEVDRPLAIDADRSWMLTTDRGVTLGDSHEPTIEDWQSVVVTAAHLQREVAAHRDAIVATGVADCSPRNVIARFDTLLVNMTSLPTDHPARIDDALAAQLAAVRPRIEGVAEQVATSPIPCTLQHGDLHPWNVFATSSGLRLFDFGDVQWAPAVEVLSVPNGVIAHGEKLKWAPIFDAYAEQWADVLDAGGVQAVYDATKMTQAVNRAQTWWDSLIETTDEELAEWGDAPLFHLRRLLEP